MNGELGGRIRSCCSVGKAWSEGTGTSLVYGVGQEGWACFEWVFAGTTVYETLPNVFSKANSNKTIQLPSQCSFLSHNASKSLQKIFVLLGRKNRCYGVALSLVPV